MEILDDLHGLAGLSHGGGDADDFDGWQAFRGDSFQRLAGGEACDVFADEAARLVGGILQQGSFEVPVEVGFAFLL